MEFTPEEILETILMREISKEFNNEFLKAINDPNYTPKLTPAVFDPPRTEEESLLARKYWDTAINRDIGDLNYD